MKFNKYDSVFLNEKEYIAIEMFNFNNKIYFLLSSSKDNDELDFNNLKIVEYYLDNGVSHIKEVNDQKLYLELERNFVKTIENL